MSDVGDRDRLRVSAMIQAAEEVRRDSAGGKTAFLQPGLAQKAVLLDLIHLTESAEKTSASLKKLNPNLPWEKLSRMRNHGLVHEYGEVDLEELWNFVRDDLPRLRATLERLKYTSKSQ